MVHVLRFLTGANIWVALAAACMCLLGFALPFSLYSLRYGGLIFLATLAAYHYMRLFQHPNGAYEANPQQDWEKRNPAASLSFLFLGGFLSLAILYRFWPWRDTLLFLPATLVTLAYPLGFRFPARGFSSLRSMPGLKLALVAFVWAYLSILLPSWLENRQWSVLAWGDFILRFLLVAGLTIPFDVRDMHLDPAELKTVPQRLGAKLALQTAQAALLLNQLWYVLRFFFLGGDLSQSLAWILALEIGFWLIWLLQRRSQPWLVSLWIEAVPLYAVLFWWLAQRSSYF